MARLIDYFPDWITGGIFTSHAMDWCPWCLDLSTDELSGLDVEYFGNRSGYKTASPLLDKIAYRVEERQVGSGDPQDPRILMLRNVLKAMYGYEWTKLWDAWKVQYDPIHNYDMTEGIVDHTHEDEDTDTETNAKSETNMHTTNSVKPLNSSAYEGLSKSDMDTDTTHNKLYNTEGKDRELNKWETIDKTRSGNIGTLSYQDMLQKEMDLRKNHFFDIIMADLDKVLTIPYWW